jgi:hypothetical protein
MGEDRKRRQELAAGGRQELAAGGRQELAAGGGLPQPPRLPERAAIYIAPDGTVHFGALFEGLLPVAEALTAGAPPPAPSHQPPAENEDANPGAGGGRPEAH